MGIGHPAPPGCFLIWGPSGSGVTTALNCFEAFGFLTAGPVSPAQLPALYHSLAPQSERLALSMKLDPQNSSDLDQTIVDLQAFKASVPDLRVLILEAPETVLIQRYLHSAKPHPFERNGLQQAVSTEHLLYQKLAQLKDYAINTDGLSPEELRHKVAKILGISLENQEFTVYITSFGFKHGVPQDAELVFDMRFLKNPFYDETLRPLTGLDQPVKDYLFALPQATEFLERWTALIEMMLPLYRQEGKTRLTIAIGCTGGQHRSVCMTETLADSLRQAHPSYNIGVVHREMAKWPAKGCNLGASIR